MKLPPENGIDLDRRGRLPLRLLVSLALLVAALASAGTALGDRPAASVRAPIPIIRDGLWTGRDSRGLVITRVRSHRVVTLAFLVTLDCHNHDTGEDYERSFRGGRNLRPATIPRNGMLVRHWTETDSGRTGDISAEFDWRGRRFALLATFSIDVPLEPPGLESCTGFAAIPARRSPG